MELGQLSAERNSTVVFVFEDLIGHLIHPRVEKTALKLRRFAAALDAWELDYQVCDYINHLIVDLNTSVDVLTWRPTEFAHLLHDRLYEQEAFVGEVKSTVYDHISTRISVDPLITLVYDADPAHRYGYGFKGREFSTGQY